MFDYSYEDILNSLPKGTKEEADKIRFSSVMPLFWNEHCLECGAPECYKTCVLFEEDRYGKCMRTHYGIQVDEKMNPLLPICKFRFKKWGKMRCDFNTQISYSAEEYEKIYLNGFRKNKKKLSKIHFDSLVKKRYRNFFARLYRKKYITKYSAKKGSEILSEKELCFVFHSYEKEDFNLILDARNFGSEKVLLRTSFKVHEGFNHWSLPYSFFEKNASEIEALELYPENNTEAELLFIISDFITPKTSLFHAAKAKCVVWDLDNTLWDGIIADDGAEGVKIRPRAAELIKELDERGVLQSIASKNDPDEPIKVLKENGLWDYFLYPQINWNPKSHSISKIRDKLNIGIDTFVLIDDSENERGEVSKELPAVRTYSDREIENILSFPEFDLVITEDTKKRRLYYLAELKRTEDMESGDTVDYENFIKKCNIAVNIAKCNAEDIEIARCSELIQRTNQLNSATRRLKLDQLKSFAEQGSVLKLRCRDNYGDYGIIGCIILSENTVTDFVFSCRVAQKKCESAVIYSLCEKLGCSVKIHFEKSAKNGILFDEFISIGGKYDENERCFTFDREKMNSFDWVKVIFEA